MRIAGFDISSNTIGSSVLETTETIPKVVVCSFYSPPKNGTYIERLVATRDKINEILIKFSPDEIGIEQITQFMGGRSTAKTIIALARFNACVGLACFDYNGKSPEFYSVIKIRHGIKENKKLPDKTEIPELVAKHLNIKFPYTFMKKKPEKIAVESYDAADSLAVAYFHFLQLTK